ncbi:uncharacterized protein LOC104905807 [Beta vulgaris subsp. vulgaris]|uniref:uncharacterized protein LOC104905807 n=1 Tax=Beta vulgaris subsp. vulgaris TaxID=3555 RepID=UPI002036D8E6|nr:uncharacterized protein LOC104905807 [Beta vulgaris subsp. vulgaris]
MADNCLIAHEIVSSIKQRTKGKQYDAALKIDMFKAYDKVDWNFLHWLLIQMKITARLLTKGSEEHIFQGIKLSRTGPSVSHLFFADDSLIFFKATPASCEGLKNILSKFSRLSGEVIIMFSPNTPPESRHQMRNIVNTPSAESLGKYLGCNVEVNGRASRQFLPLVEKVENRLSSWHHRSLSMSGRLILINSVLAMLSLYILSVFLIPKTTADKLNSIFARFLWAGSRETKPIYWKSMAILELPKGGGGLGIRNVHLFNKALLAKQAVRIHSSSSSLISQVYCFVKLIRDGAGTSILEDRWLKGEAIKLKPGINLEAMGLRQVKDLMKQNHRAWNTPLIWRVFSPDTAIRVLSTYLPQETFHDQFSWSESKSGIFRVKDVYTHFLRQKGNLDLAQTQRSFWSKLWALDLRPKWKMFVWRLIHKALATNSNLIKRNILVQPDCYLCHQQKEDENHLFRDCSISAHVWSSSTLGLKSGSSQVIPLGEWVRNFLQLFWKEDGTKSERAIDFVAILWSIWLHRNNIVFRQIYDDPSSILRSKDILLRDWTESKIVRGSSSKKTLFTYEVQQEIPCYPSTNSRDDICVMVVDGAWKRHKDKFPRAGIGWSAKVNGTRVFEGNARIVASSSLQTEAQAVFRGIYEAKLKGFQHLHIHSDSVDVVRTIGSTHQPFEIATVIHDIRALQREFSSCIIKKVARMDVLPAHRLAVAARQGNLVS